MHTKEIMSELIALSVFEYIESHSFGVILKDLPSYSYTVLLETIYTKVNEKDNPQIEFPYIFFVGFQQEEIEKIKGESNDVLKKFNSFFSVEEAEKYRNKGEISATRIVIAKRSIAKLSSLKWFEEIEGNQLYDLLCVKSQNLFKGINNPLFTLWRAFKNKTIKNIVPLERLVDYFQYFISNDDNIDRDTITQMYRLGMLADEKLFSGFSSGDQKDIDIIRRRLIENKKNVLRISSLDKGDQKALQESEIENGNAILAHILSYYTSRNNVDLKEMKLHEVVDILNKVSKRRKKQTNKPEEDKTQRNKKSRPNSSESLGVNLVIDHDTEQIKDVLDKVNEEFNNWERNSKESVRFETDEAIADVTFIPQVYNLINAFIGEDTFGGIIQAEVNSPVDALNSINIRTVSPFTQSEVDEIIAMLSEFTNEFEEVKEILKLFRQVIDDRKKISPNVHRLADIPILKIAENLELSRLYINYINNYGKFLNELKSHFNRLSSFSSGGTKELIARINSLDVIYILGDSSQHAVLSPLNPFYLWKYVELTRRLLETSSDLTDLDKDFLTRASEEIPNPLPTLFVSNFISNDGDITIQEVGQIGKLPIYSSEQQVNNVDDGLSAIKRILKKFVNLFQHSKFGLRVAFINPPNVSGALKIFKDLIDTNIINGAHIDVFKTKETFKNWSSLEDVNESLLNIFGIGKTNNFTLKVHHEVTSMNNIVSLLKKKPCHLVILFDPSKRTVSDSKRDPSLNLKIHPLCVPRVFNYDPIQDKLEIVPSAEGNLFSDHHDLLAKLNDRPRGWHKSVVSDSKAGRGEIRGLLEEVDWLVVADNNLKNMELNSIGTNKCLYFESNQFRDVGVYTKNWLKFTKIMNEMIREMGNYNPLDKCIDQMLRELQILNEKGILHLTSNNLLKSFDSNHTKGAIGSAISAYWFKKNYKDSILISLDTDLARNWLSEREGKIVSDLIGIRVDEEDGVINEESVYIDIIEVKTYDAYTVDKEGIEISGEAVEQVQAVNNIIREIFYEQDKITSTSRREILRYQVYRNLHQLNLTKNKKRFWSNFLNDVFSGKKQVNIQLCIHHVCFNDHGTTNNNGENYHAENPIKLVKIKDDIITEVFTNCDCHKIEPVLEKKVSSVINLNMTTFFKKGIDHSETKKEDIDYDESVYNNENFSKGELSKFNDESKETLKEEDRSSAKNDDDNDQKQSHYQEDVLTQFLEKTATSLYRAMTDYSIDVLEVDPKKALVASRFVRFRVRLKPGEKLQKVLRVRSDIAREIEASSEILIDNEMGTNFIFVDVPRSSSETINLLDYISGIPKEDIGNLNVIVGQDPSGEIVLMNISNAPHLLTAGSTGSGKTIFLYSIIVSLISQYNSNELELVIIDPKQTDFIFFENLPHLRNSKIIIEAGDAVEMVNELVEYELKERTNLLRESRNRDIFSYNENNPEHSLKPILVIIDEYADLVQVADFDGKKEEFERNMIRLAQRSRNVGIHLVIATQRPSADIVTSRLKANIPTRISFSLPANQDSRTILDSSGAEDLLGKGDMLYSVNGELRRLQGLFISERELQEYLKQQL